MNRIRNPREESTTYCDFFSNGEEVNDEFLKGMGIRNPELTRKFNAIVAAAFAKSEPEIATSSNLTVRTFFELLAMEFSTDDFLLENGYLAKGEPLTIVGPPSVGKTRFYMQLLIALLTGRDFLGWKTNGKNTRWLILQTENGNRRLKSELCRMASTLNEKEKHLVNEGMFFHTL